jgi:replicative DNA helicase
VPAVGKMPDAATVFVGCLLWSSPDDAAGVLRLMAGDDFDAPLSVLVATIRHLVEAGKPCDASLVGDELRRTGQLSGPVAQALSAASVAGAIPEAAPYYAAIVVSKALRRKAESYGYALSTAAANAAECELLPLVTSAAADIAGTSHRLALLRGEA